MVGRIYQLPIIVDYDMDCRGQLYFCVKICVDTEYGWGFNKKYKMILEVRV